MANLHDDALREHCPICNAKPSEKCISSNGVTAQVPHFRRGHAWVEKYDKLYRVEPEGGFFKCQ
jgi:hypothetical protein